MGPTLKSRLTYANVLATLAIFIALGGVGFAAVTLKKNSVKSKHIKDGAVQTQDLGDGAVTAGKLSSGAIANDTITGAQVNESTLEGVNAAKLGGLELKKVNFQVPFGTEPRTVLEFPGKFRIDASCQNFGDTLDVAAATGENDSAISVTAMRSLEANDANGARDIASRDSTDFDTDEIVEIDSTSEFSQNTQATVQFAAPSGFVASAHLQMGINIGPGGPTRCVLSGYSIGG